MQSYYLCSSHSTSNCTTRKLLKQLLGSLRHVTTCLRATIPFFQRIAALCRSSKQHGKYLLCDGAKDNLLWVELILLPTKLNIILLVQFVHVQEPQYEVFMDASDYGLCTSSCSSEILASTIWWRLMLIKEFADSNGFDIYVREFMSAAFAAIVWGRRWKSSSSTGQHTFNSILITSPQLAGVANAQVEINLHSWYGVSWGFLRWITTFTLHPSTFQG